MAWMDLLLLFMQEVPKLQELSCGRHVKTSKTPLTKLGLCEGILIGFYLLLKGRGGRTPNPVAISNFNDNIQKTGLFDLGFSGPAFTWRRKNMWERLDRVFANDHWIQNFLQTNINHLSLAGSDHRPLVITIGPNSSCQKSTFRYLNVWSQHKDFLQIIKDNWKNDSHPDPFIRLWQKQKKIVEKVEKELLDLEVEHNKGNTDEIALLEANERVLTALNWQDQFLKQKAAKTKFTEGDRNTKFYHACINYQRKCNTIHCIKDQNGTWLGKEEEIAKSVVLYCQNLMNEHKTDRDHIEKTLFSESSQYTTHLNMTDIP
ncbi:uncharacterized protein LOC110039077 [Phalaenopsis equestris]|uniref:uncharacterized protein LOC110039077 n=1 Tax=Phalaenopsis equestris TaxID=78828 RepID=UPI0009E3C2A2|nr:uncharacterized protein LOC110039077 [Phalaenopsis equestris]